MKNNYSLYTRYITTACMLFGLCWAASAQSQPEKICATMEQDSINRAKFPQRGTLFQFEQALQYKLEEIEHLRQSGRTKAGILTIPIIVHIVHNGEAVGSGTNLSEEQVKAQIEVLNEDFRRKAGTPGFNDSPVGADIEIEFCLSSIDKNGATMTEPGIHRYNGNQPDWTRDEIENKLKPNTIWDPNKFYNIWTVKFDAADANLIGYAQFPDQSGLPGLQEEGGPASTDGVVIRYQSFGSVTKGNFPVMQAPYNRGRTLAHETGHWLGLRHIWGDGNCADDFVADTPPAAGPSTGCPVGRISCGGVNMVQNYMDYSDDVCMNIFTQGQKNRMLAVMEMSPRRKTLTQNNLCSPSALAPPVAAFTLEQQQCVLLGSQVTFTDLSTNFPSEWKWTFEGADPNSSTEKNPRVTYNSAGTFDVTLIVKNELGSDTLTLQDFVTVTEEGLCRSFNNFLPEYTPSVLNMKDFANYTGYLTGTNTARNQAYSEYFSNNCGYKYVSGVAIRFGALTVVNEETTINVTVWNARGRQNSPGAVIERKAVLAKQILQDIANNRPTIVTFDRETPVFSRPFHVGFEIDYQQGYQVAVTSSANGEATNATSWLKKADGEWELFTIEYGANIAMDIAPAVGMNPSVQVSASKLLVSPGEQVTLAGRGASIFIWSSTDGTVQQVAAPQINVNPLQTTTYTTAGSGLDLCNASASTTIYVREGVVGTELQQELSGLTIAPNPGSAQLTVTLDHQSTGEVEIMMESMLGQRVLPSINAQKTQPVFQQTIETSSLRAGLYLVRVYFNKESRVVKWVKQ